MKKIFISKILRGDIFSSFSRSTTVDDLKIFFKDDTLRSYSLTKKSKTSVVDYYNIRFFFEKHALIMIQINFEKKYDLLVETDIFKGLSVEDIIEQLRLDNWYRSEVLNTFIFKKDSFSLSFDKDSMNLHLLTINFT